jgi:hypothetical protein
MCNSLSTRAVRACAAGTLLLSLTLTFAFADMSAFAGTTARPGMGPGHFASPGFLGFSRLGVNRARPGRFGFDRFGSNRFGINWFGFNRFGLNANGLESGLLGLGGWGYWGYPQPSPETPAAPVIVDAGSPPVAINVYTGGGADDPPAGSCVVHLLDYDTAGRYVGERQFPGC